ncbi:importin-alpha export receptor [Microbotryomycetes sp. JL221]|nr:importin-alpha export receptor [Microbotryomycetes sp. JL221]
MDSLASVLTQTLSPDATTRRNAERQLVQAQQHDSFGHVVLELTRHTSTPKPIRQSAALSFKNWIKANWALEDAPTPLTTQSAQHLKHSIVDIMISLANEPTLQIQIAQAIAIMARADFPDQWSTLIDQLVQSLSPTDFVINNAILQTAHSIFHHWRSQFRTDDLFLQIKFVLERFCQPYLSLFQQTDALLASPDITPQQHVVLQHTILLLLQLYHDLNSQDLPEFFEDRLPQFMNLLLKYLDYEPPQHIKQATSDDNDDDDDEQTEPTDLEHIKAQVCEIAQLYSLRYLDAFGEGGFLGPFVEKTWGLLTKLGSAVKYDTLVSKATGFLGVVVKMSSQKTLFESQQTLEAFCEKIVLPNMTLRTFEEELFQDDPPEYVRRDLDSTSSETRRQAASDFTKALMEQFQTQITTIISRYVGAYLEQYNSNPQTNWKSKDTAIFLLTSIASKSSTIQLGVTSTNNLVDVVSFFSQHVLNDLQADSTTVHPIIQADAIKFLYTFRNQLTKEQLLSVLPLLNPHLANRSFVIHTYAAITIERMLFIKQNNTFLFGQADIAPYADGIINALLTIIESGQTPQQIAANDNLMKSVMRVIFTAKQTLLPTYQTILNRLTRIVIEISKNPSNPKFNHFTFESISALVRFITSVEASSLTTFEQTLFPPFQTILQQDVSEFTPFVFQIISQLFELYPSSTTTTTTANETKIPEHYKMLLPPLLTPTLWESRGNVPALVRLLTTFLNKSIQSILELNQLSPILGIFQHLIASKQTDQFGFELLESIVEFVPILQTSKTEKFTQGLIKLICFLNVIEKPGLDCDVVIGFIEGVQPGLFGQVLPLLLPESLKVSIKDRKLVAVGLTNLLTRSSIFLSPPTSNAWTPTMTCLLKMFNLGLPNSKTTTTTTTNEQGTGLIVEEEIEIQELEETGYQTSFSKLNASQQPIKKNSIVSNVNDVKFYLAQNLIRLSQSRPGQVQPMIEACGSELAGPFLTYMNQNGLTLS